MLKSKILAVMFLATVGSEKDLAQAAYYTAIGDSSPESEAVFTKALDLTSGIILPKGSRFVPPAEEASLSGIDFKDRKMRKGSLERIEGWLKDNGAELDSKTREAVAQIEARNHRAIVVADQERDIGVIELI